MADKSLLDVVQNKKAAEKKPNPFVDALREKARTSHDSTVKSALTAVADVVDSIEK